MPDEYSRRNLLLAAAVMGSPLAAGCTDILDDEGDTTETSTPDITPTETPVTGPEVLDYEIEPIEYGTSLIVALEGEAQQGIDRAAISFGDLRIEETPDDVSITVEGELTDIHETDHDETPGTVVFTLEDTGGEVTEVNDQPHTGSPTVSIESTATPTPGELELVIEVTDELGLHLLQVDVNGTPVEEVDLTGTDETTYERSLANDQVADGESNELTTKVRNTFGSTRSAIQDQYVREFEPIEDREIEVGAVYMPFFEHQSQWVDCAVGMPAVGGYYMDDEAALNRHGDLMSGFGISRQQFDFFDPPTDSPVSRHSK